MVDSSNKKVPIMAVEMTNVPKRIEHVDISYSPIHIDSTSLMMMHLTFLFFGVSRLRFVGKNDNQLLDSFTWSPIFIQNPFS